MAVLFPRTSSMLQTLAIAHYRSLHGLDLPLQQLNVITGDNGSGKSSLYRAKGNGRNRVELAG